MSSGNYPRASLPNVAEGDVLSPQGALSPEGSPYVRLFARAALVCASVALVTFALWVASTSLLERWQFR